MGIKTSIPLSVRERYHTQSHQSQLTNSNPELRTVGRLFVFLLITNPSPLLTTVHGV